MLPLVIVNPKSAGGSTRDNWSATASDLRAHFGPFKVAFTKAAGDGTTLAKKAAESGRKFIIACGGDGTINEVANGILESGADVEFGILPSGTGGDFRRSLGLPQSAREAARVLRDGRTELIDAGKVSFHDLNGKPASRYFLNISSFGLAASIIERVKANKTIEWLPLGGVRGRANFALSTIQEVMDLEPLTVRIKIDDGEERPLQTINCCIANARYFGGGMMIAPDAKLNDGAFDIVNIGDIKTLKILINLPSLYKGSHLEMAEVRSSLAKRVEVASADPSVDIHLEIDGELPGRLPAVFEIVPKALRIRIPRK